VNKLLIIAIAFLLIGWVGYQDLHHDMKYLCDWTASEMGVKLNPKKPIPVLVIIAEPDLTKLVEKKCGLKSKYEEVGGTIIVTYHGIFFPDESAIYINSGEKDLEKAVVHELVHYIQYTYLGAKKFTRETEEQAIKIANIYEEEMK